MRIENPVSPYFAHMVNIYGTPLEGAAVALIRQTFPDAAIQNPNEPEHQKAYGEYARRAKESGTTHKGMNYFYDVMLPKCDGCVSMVFLDRKMGLGVAGESKWFLERGMNVWLLAPSRGLETAKEDIDRFIAHPTCGVFDIMPMTKGESAALMAWQNDKADTLPSFVVPHIETRLRTFFVYGKNPKRPYLEAHLAPVTPPPDFYPNG